LEICCWFYLRHVFTNLYSCNYRLVIWQKPKTKKQKKEERKRLRNIKANFMAKAKRKKLRIKELKRQGYSYCDIGKIIMDMNNPKTVAAEAITDINFSVPIPEDWKPKKKSLFTRFIEFVINIYNKIFN
jgi:hypothetical protein